MKKNKYIYITSGLALFAMYFGAGNLIFPTEIGFYSQNLWYIGSLGFLITAVGLPLLTLLALNNAGGSIFSFFDKLSPKISRAISCLVVLLIGPIFAVPRIGTVVYGLSVKPLFEFDEKQYIAIFLFFVIVAFVCLKPSKIVNNIGNMMTPILFASLAFIIIKGIISIPSSVQMTDIPVKKIFNMGFLHGYQTMDAFASIISGTIIIGHMRVNSPSNSITKNLLKSFIIACSLLFLIYVGLIFVSSEMSKIYVANGGVISDLNQTDMLNYLVYNSMGDIGKYVLSVCVFFACLSTAVALIDITAKSFYDVFDRKLSYKTLALIATLISFIISNVGLSNIIKLAVPVLVLIYPFIVSLAFSLLLFKNISSSRVRYIVIFTIIATIPDVLKSGFNTDVDFLIDWLPLYDYSLQWIFPAMFGALVGYFVDKVSSHQKRAN